MRLTCRSLRRNKSSDGIPKSGIFVNTLGVAFYRAGNWKQAIAVLTRSMELRQGGDRFDWFFLAMAHWELGHKDESRQWYERAVTWMEKHRPNDDELRRFRAEAAGLLGREPRTDREEEYPPEDGAIYADRLLHADSSAARARGNHSIGQPAEAAMPNGPEAFARP